MDRAIVLYWYAVHGRTHRRRDRSARSWLLHDSLRFHRSDAALVRIVVPVTGPAIDAAEREGARLRERCASLSSASLELKMSARSLLFAVPADAADRRLFTARARRAHTYVQRGDEQFAAGRYNAAAIEYRNAIKKEPATAEAHRKLADTYLKQGKPEDAYRAYANAVELDPATSTRASRPAGCCSAPAGTPRRWSARNRRSSATSSNVDAQILAGRALTGLRRVDEAMAQLDAAVDADHRAEAYAALADAKLAAGDATGAEAALRAGVAAHPQSADARVTLARYLA